MRDRFAVGCTQIEWMLMIEAAAGPGQAEAPVRLGGPEPVVQTVSITNVDGFHGVVGGDRGSADAALTDGTYTITGTAVGSRGAVEKRPAPFEIEASC